MKLPRWFVQGIAFVAMAASMLLSAYYGILAQVSTPDYRAMYFGLLPAAVINVPLIAFLFFVKPRMFFWSALIPAGLACVSHLEMTRRVFL